MELIAFIVAIGLMAFLLLYIAFNLEPEHWILKLMVLFFFIILMVLLPKAIFDEKDNCQVVISNSTVLPGTNTTVNEYKNFCITNENKTPYSFLKVAYWFMTLFYVYILLYLVYWLFIKKGLKGLAKK